jgi:hypothetical protein
VHIHPIAVSADAGDFGAGVSAAPGLKPELRKALDDFVSQNKIVLFMKGTQQVSQMCPAHLSASMMQPLAYVIHAAINTDMEPLPVPVPTVRVLQHLRAGVVCVLL